MDTLAGEFDDHATSYASWDGSSPTIGAFGGASGAAVQQGCAGRDGFGVVVRFAGAGVRCCADPVP